MQAMLGTAIAADLTPGVRYDQLVSALGGHGELVTAPEKVNHTFEQTLKSGLPACVNVLTDSTAEYPRSAALI